MATDVLKGMRVFTAVVDAGSFAKAAEELDLSRGMTSHYGERFGPSPYWDKGIA